MNRRAMKKPPVLLSTLLLPFALALAACDSAQKEPPPLAGAAIGGPFTLQDKAGKAVQWADFAGKWRIVYFGYTYCPDACPTDVGVFMNGLGKFAKDHPAEAAKIQPIFITIDPERDTPARVGEFAAAFGGNLIGLTGSKAAIEQAEKAFIVYAARGKDVPGGGYLMDHSRVTYLMDPDGKPIAMLPVDRGPEAVAAELAKWVS
jgi:protein SCO1/2